MAEDRMMAIELITEAVENGARRVPACKILGISLRTLQRWEAEGGGEDRREGAQKEPGNALSEPERALVIAIASSPRFRDLPPSQIVPILADAGVYVASESSFYRILRQEKLLAHRGRARTPRHSRPKEYVATGPNKIWSWDITYCRGPVRGQFYYLYLVVDVWSRKIVGWAVHEQESEQLAAELIREVVLREGVDGKQLVMHSDNGGPMKGATMLATLQWLGIVPSFSRPRVSDDNPYSEALFRTLKYRPEYPRVAFESLEATRQWVQGFVRWYNEKHRHSAIRFVTPSQRHSGEEQKVLRRRKEVYEEVRKENPSRWTGGVREWTPVGKVILNPEARSSNRLNEERESA